MKHMPVIFLVAMLLLVSVAVLPGCVSQAPSSQSLQQAPAQVTAAPAQNPITGVWRYYNSSSMDQRIRFNADGTLVESVYFPATADKVTLVINGTWRPQDTNSYLLTAGGTEAVMIYDPAQKALYFTVYPNRLLTPYQGDLMAASSAPVTGNAP